MDRILFILHLPPPVHGAAMMGKYIHDSQRVNKSFTCRYLNLTTAKGLEDIGKASLMKLVHFVKLLARIRKAVADFKPSLVYVTPNAKGGAFLKDFIVVQLLKFMGCSIVLHYHNKGVSQYQDKPLYHFLYRRFFKGVKVILLARALYTDIAKYVSLDNVYFCPNGIPNDTHPTENTTRKEVPTLLFLSNLLIAKGVLVLLDACQLLQQQGIIFHCNIIGGETTDFDADSFQREIDQRNLGASVSYLGKKYGIEKEKHLEQADIFVLPTLNECFPLVLLEAMQHRTACIGTDEGGIPDMIEEGVTGFIIPKNDVGSLTQKLALLLQDAEKTAEMGEAGFEKFQRMFTLQQFEEKFVAILSACLQTKDNNELMDNKNS